MDDSGPRLRWGMEQRLAFIEFRLFWDGGINRGDIMERFGVSAPQASSDLARYEAMAPGNLEYDSAAKTYVPGAGFRTHLRTPTAEDYLAAVQSVLSGAATENGIWPRSVSAFDSVPTLRRQIPVEVLRTLVKAIRTRSAVHIRYQSFSKPEPAWRWFTPHAIAFDGLRWHARAWCQTHGDFRDFVIARILETGANSSSNADASCDAEWHRRVTLRLAANPALPREQRQSIEFDYGMVDGVLAVPMRVCHAYYFERLHGLDADPSAVDPKRQQVVLLNGQEVAEARTLALDLTRKALAGRGLVDPDAGPPPTPSSTRSGRHQ